MSKKEMRKMALDLWKEVLKTLKDARDQGKTLNDVIFALENLVKSLEKET